MNELKYNYESKLNNYLTTIKAAKANKSTKRPVLSDFGIVDGETFLDHALSILANIPLVKNDKGLYSPTLISEAMPDTIDTPNGPISKLQMRNLIGFLHFPARGMFVKNQGKTPKLGALTPLGLYAFKLYRNIPYEAWDKTDPKLAFYLGYTLANILKTPKVTLTHEDVHTARQRVLTYASGKKAGQTEKLTSHKMPLNVAFQQGEEIVKIDKIPAYMLLQTWLANIELRDTSSMILDPWDWDKVPEPIDEVVVHETKVEKLPPAPDRFIFDL